MIENSTLLKIMSILLIVLGFMAVFINGVAQKSIIESIALSIGDISLSLGLYIFLLLALTLELTAGFIGLAWKLWGVLMKNEIAVIIMTLISLIVNTVIYEFQVIMLLSLILPVLYVCGWRSKI